MNLIETRAIFEDGTSCGIQNSSEDLKYNLGEFRAYVDLMQRKTLVGWRRARDADGNPMRELVSKPARIVRAYMMEVKTGNILADTERPYIAIQGDR